MQLSLVCIHALILIHLNVFTLVHVCFCPQDGSWTALHWAAQEGKVDVVRLLTTEAKAHVNIQAEVHTLCHISVLISTFSLSLT